MLDGGLGTFLLKQLLCLTIIEKNACRDAPVNCATTTTKCKKHIA